MKVSELIGAELDFYVAKAEGIENVEIRTAQRSTNRICIVRASGGRQFDYTYSPSTQWNVAGPIIQRERISIIFVPETKQWESTANHYEINDGSHPNMALIAAMRAYVFAKFGEDVEEI